MAAREKKILELLEPSIEDLGYELIDVEFQRAPGGGTLRLYIDSAKGIDLEDCEAVSRQAGAVLDVEDPIPGNYNLEVSSPGVDRVLRTTEHFAAFAGCEVTIRLKRPVDGRRKVTGVIGDVSEQQIVVQADGADITVELDDIEKARLVPDYNELLSASTEA